MTMKTMSTKILSLTMMVLAATVLAGCGNHSQTDSSGPANATSGQPAAAAAVSNNSVAQPVIPGTTNTNIQATTNQ
jgi:outer membrane PBP1 activator LpoA protein